MSVKALKEVSVILWRNRAMDWRNYRSDLYYVRTELLLKYAHECDLIADALEAGQLEPKLLGY